MAYSLDLRIRAVEAKQQESATIDQISKLFQIGSATLKRWMRRKRDNKTVERILGTGGRKPRIGKIGVIILLHILDRCPDATLRELSEKYRAATGLRLGKSVIDDTLKRLGITRKKKQFLMTSSKVSESRNFERILPTP